MRSKRFARAVLGAALLLAQGAGAQEPGGASEQGEMDLGFEGGVDAVSRFGLKDDERLTLERRALDGSGDAAYRLDSGLNLFVKGKTIVNGADPYDVLENLPRYYGEGYYVGGHGSAWQVLDEPTGKLMAPKDLAKRICSESNYHCEDIRLFACATGRLSFAQELADELSVTVYAPTGEIGWYRKGEGQSAYYWLTFPDDPEGLIPFTPTKK